MTLETAKFVGSWCLINGLAITISLLLEKTPSVSKKRFSIAEIAILGRGVLKISLLSFAQLTILSHVPLAIVSYWSIGWLATTYLFVTGISAGLVLMSTGFVINIFSKK